MFAQITFERFGFFQKKATFEFQAKLKVSECGEWTEGKLNKILNVALK